MCLLGTAGWLNAWEIEHGMRKFFTSFSYQRLLYKTQTFIYQWGKKIFLYFDWMHSMRMRDTKHDEISTYAGNICKIGGTRVKIGWFSMRCGYGYTQLTLLKTPRII